MAFVPQRFGKYYLIDKIAVGGMAEIFRAKQFGEGGFEKLLVIKRILSHLSEEQDFVQMFFDEARISSTLGHSNIVHVYDFGRIQSNYFIAMEYCEGKDLKTIMKKCQEIGRPLPVEYAVYIIHEVLKGLDYAHRKKNEYNEEMNILHRDISPSNVIVSYDEGKVKLADFGIAKAESATYKTKAGVLKGKFEYMSPEQASGLPIDRRSDIFSVGICLYELLTRRRLFKTDSDLRTLELIRNPLIPPPSHLNPQVSEELDAIVMKALARRPEDRYQEAWQMQHELRELMRSSTPPTSPDLIALSLANFMQEIFEREIRQERARLDKSSRIVRQLLAEEDDIGLEDESWEIPSDGSRVVGGLVPPDGTEMRLMLEEARNAKTARWPLIALLLVLVAVLGSVLLFQHRGEDGASILSASARETSEYVPLSEALSSPPDASAPDQPRYASLKLDVEPAGASVYLDDTLIGEAPLVYRRLKVGALYTLRIEARGYKTSRRQIRPAAPQDMTLKIVLEPEVSGKKASRTVASGKNEKKKAVSSSSSKSTGVLSAPAAEPAGSLAFYSEPSPARVVVGGRLLCTTPCAKVDGRPEAWYDVTIEAPGYEPFKTRVRFPARGQEKVNAVLRPLALGRLSLTIKDGLSAEVFIDGKPYGIVSSLDQLQLPAGSHSIRLRNQVAGLERRFKVNILPGEETRLLEVDLQEP